LKILFAGTPSIAVPLLQEISSRFEVCAVLTSPDRPSGRSGRPQPSPVKAKALELKLPVLQFETLKTDARNAVAATGANTLVTFAFGKIFGPRFLALFDRAFNIHPSALPLLRGPSPIQGQILGCFRTGAITLQSLSEKMDQGDIWAVDGFELDGTETTQSLTHFVALRASSFVPDALSDIVSGRLQPRPQEGQATYCTMIDAQSAYLNFGKRACEVHATVRAMYPKPKAWTLWSGQKVMITSVWGGFDSIKPFEGQKPECGSVVGFDRSRGIGVVCSDAVIWINGLQLPAKKELDHVSFVNGNRGILEARFGE